MQTFNYIPFVLYNRTIIIKYINKKNTVSLKLKKKKNPFTLILLLHFIITIYVPIIYIIVLRQWWG